jgi:exonuclease III
LILPQRTTWRISPNQVSTGGQWASSPLAWSVPNITLSVQNCNSLNISTNCDKQLAKLIAITALCTDIIFLCDTRINDNQVEIDKLSKSFLCNSKRNYFFHFNTHFSKRGVGILIACDLACNIIHSYMDNDSNILGMVLENGTSIFSVVSIYGPNENNKKFFSNLSGFISTLGDFPVVIGGDWNATYSQSPAGHNIDIINMISPPSLIRSGWIADLCDAYNLLDPFRAFHPTQKEFSFFPHGARKNRSRLDFFLISNPQLNHCRSCSISLWISISLFDHKSVFLDFTADKTKSKLFNNRSIISNPMREDIVLGAFSDTYLTHADPAFDPQDPLVHHLNPGRVLEQQKGVVGRFIQLTREYNHLLEREVIETGNNLIPLLKAGIIRELELQRENIWDVERYFNLKLSCSDDFFLEALVSNIKGCVISFQTFIRRLENLKKSGLVKRLSELKKNYDDNFELISSIEEELNSILNSETLLKVQSMKLFSCLNSEKPTPIFLGLARASNSNAKLNKILDVDGAPFLSEESRTESIITYYENLYDATDSENIDYSNCIENFLGKDILEHPLVAGSKLTADEKDRLDSPLTLEELDQSMDKCNLRSALGIDGLRNIFIKRFWHYLRRPLYNYALCCYEKGKLTTNFRSASIKLIPKKGNISQLKNWRPISLLSNLYKILSCTINTRLSAIVNRICTRAQKSFNNQRYTQECLINVISTIQHCQSNCIRGAVVAVDMAKAFDTLSHRFL